MAGGNISLIAQGSVSASRTKIDSEYRSVVEQSGIRAGGGGFQVSVKGSTELIGGAITSSDQAVAEGKNSFTTTTLTTSELQNQAAYSAKSVSVSAGTSAGSTSAGIGNQSDSASSTTRSGISGIAGDKSARTGDAESGLTRIFDAQTVKADVQAQVAITQEFGKQAPKAVADFAASQIKGLDAQIKDAAAIGDTTRVSELNTEKAKWAEGGDYRVAMHATIGALSGGVQGALGAAASTEAAPLIDSLQASLEKNLRDAGVNPSVAKVAGQAVANVTSAGIGMAAGGTGGAAMALNVDANNRQLHPDEEKWLKTKAKDFASQLSAQSGRPVSEEEALQRLGQQAVRQTDLVWRSLLSDGDDAAAKAFLSQAKDTFANETNERQRLFTVNGQQLLRPEMYADSADASFYRGNVQPGVTRTLSQGLPKEVKDLGVDFKNSAQQGAGKLYDAAKNDPLGTAGAVGSALWEGIKAAPGAIKDSVKETGTAIGEGLAVATDKELGNKLNAIYGTDVSTAQQTLTGVRIAAAVSGAAGTAKMVTTLGDVAIEGTAKVVKKVDEALDKSAADALRKNGGVYDNSGRPVLDTSKLSSGQKEVLGELLGENTVKQIIPDGQKLARIPGVGENGIDDLYKVKRPDVDYVVIEYKFVSDEGRTGASALKNTGDGKQGSESWTLGSKRVENAVESRAQAESILDAVKAGRTETWVVTTRSDGSTTVQVLDAAGKAKNVDTSKLILPGVNLSGAKP